MTNVGNGPSLGDLSRRVQRIEDKVDERIATTEMLRAQEKLFEARELAQVAACSALESRIKALEENAKVATEGERNRNRLITVALLSGLINLLLLLVTITSKGAG
jgi:hypothetical protein